MKKLRLGMAIVLSLTLLLFCVSAMAQEPAKDQAAKDQPAKEKAPAKKAEAAAKPQSGSTAPAAAKDKKEAGKKGPEAKEKPADKAAVKLPPVTKAEKDEFVKKTDSRIEVLGKNIKNAEAKIDKAEGQQKVDIKNKVDALKKKKESIDKKYAEMKTATDDKWRTMRQDVEKDLGDAEQSYLNLISSSKVFAKEEKSEYQKSYDSKLENIKGKISYLESMAPSVSADNKKEFDKNLKDLKAKKEAVEKKLKSMESKSEEDWKAMQGELDRAFVELDEIYEKVNAKVK